MNTWPDGKRKALTQSEHEAWNSSNFPGSRQLCCCCDEPTGFCEEDSLYLEPITGSEGSSLGPLCDACYEERINPPTTAAKLD